MKVRIALIAFAFLPSLLSAQAKKLTIDDIVSGGSVRGGGSGPLSPDGKFFASDQRGQITLVPTGGGQPVVLTATPEAKSEMHWSHDGRQIAYISGGDAMDCGYNRRLRATPLDARSSGSGRSARRYRSSADVESEMAIGYCSSRDEKALMNFTSSAMMALTSSFWRRLKYIRALT